jgi:hypothetical protein
MCSICNDPTHQTPADDWADLEDASFSGRATTPAQAPAMPATPTEFVAAALSRPTYDPTPVATFEEPCSKCRGRGRFISHSGRDVGPCFTCKGTGKQVFKTSAETRQKNADAAKARKAAQIVAWMEAHKEEWEWLVAAAGRGFNFASDQIEALGKYGDLNDSRLTHIRRFMVKDQQREQEKIEIAERAPDIAGAALDKIDTAFATAIDKGIKFPKLRLGTFIFSAVRTGANAGAIYVKSIERDDNGERRYMGKIMDGRFVRSYKTTAEEEQQIIEAATDPAAAAKAYGQRTGTCSICGRKLTRNESIDRAMGPVCADNYGWS